MVKYRGTCDLYVKYYIFNSASQEFEEGWDYDSPEQIECNVTELNPENVQELFGQGTYEYTKTIKLEVPIPLLLSSRIGHIRLGDEVFEDMIFNIDNVQPRIDYRGKVIGYRIICRSALV